MRVNILFTSILCAITGCGTYTKCEWQREADIVQTTWENEFGEPLTREESMCLHAFSIRHKDQVCNDSRAVGCTRQRRNGAARISIKSGLTPLIETMTIRHELTHRILMCVTGSGHDNHDHEAFAYSGNVSADYSLAFYSFEYENDVFTCE